MLLTVSGLQGCDLVQGSDTAVDEVIKKIPLWWYK